MSAGNGKDEFDLVAYAEGRNKMPWEVQEPWAGQHVAISADGKRIVTGGSDVATVLANLDAMGIPSNTVCLDYIDGPNDGSYM
jgi:hypothetical protein